MRWILLILLCTSVVAQTVGNQPEAPDSYQDQALGGTPGQVVMPDGVNTNEEIVVCVTTDAGSAPGITDTLGNTYTLTTPTTTPAPQTGRMVYMGYTKSGSSGANTVTVAFVGSPNETFSVARFTGLSGVLDGTLQTATSTGNATGGTGSFNTSITTTNNGSLLVSCAGNSGFGQSWVTPLSSAEYISMNGEQTGSRDLLVETHTNALGTYTPTFSTYNDASFGSHATFAAQTLAFKPAAIAVVDTALPDAAATIAYSAQLHGVGGIAGLTYACTGLPSNGLSLNTGTGVISGSNPTVGTLSLGCTVTDGSTTSSTNTLSLKIQTAFNTPNVKQIQTISGDGSGDGTFGSPVACGDVIAVFYHGSDTHGGNGWLLNPNAATNKMTDSLGTVFHRVGLIAGTLNAPLVLYVGQATSAGTDKVTVTHTTSGSGLNFTMMDISGVQNVVDIGSYTNAGTQSSSPITFSNSLTTVVPNELLAMATSTGFNNSETISYSPLSVSVTSTSLCCYDVSALGYTTVVSASSYTGTATVTTGGPTSSTPAIGMWAFRPGAIPTTCAAFAGSGEKIRRQVY